MINNGTIYCPICGSHFIGSDYLINRFEGNDKLIWLSNMVTHYRHSHIKSWDKTWNRSQYNGWYNSRGGYGTRFLSDDTYKKEKRKVNNRAKRQIIRKCTSFLIENGFTVEDFQHLIGTDYKTVELAIKKLGCQMKNVA